VIPAAYVPLVAVLAAGLVGALVIRLHPDHEALGDVSDCWTIIVALAAVAAATWAAAHRL
jgi:hypothetical protein